MVTKINGHNFPKAKLDPYEFYNELKSIRNDVKFIAKMVAITSAILILGIVLFYDTKEQPPPKIELIPGSPIEINALPDGVYRWVDGSKRSFLAFVQSEAKNPFDARLFAVISLDQIPPVFVVEKGTVKAWLPEVVVENPLAEEQKEIK